MFPRRLLVSLLIGSSLVFSVAAKKAAQGLPPAVDLPPITDPDLHLRIPATGTTPALGYFLKTDGDPTRESDYQVTTCSRYISGVPGEGGGGALREIVFATTQTTARFGAPPYIGASGSNEANTSMAVDYTLNVTLDGAVTDAAGFDACCKAAPDQCPGPYISGYYKGKGGMWVLMGDERSANAGVSIPVPQLSSLVSARVQTENGWVWKNAYDFTANDVYFAFYTRPRPATLEPPPNWLAGDLPRSTQGTWMVGEASGLPTEPDAVTVAENDAFKKLVKSVCGVDISTADTEGGRSTQGTSGSTSSAKRTTNSTFDAAGFLRGVEFIDKWSEKVPNSNPPAWQAKRLAFMSTARIEAAEGSTCTGATASAPPEEGTPPDGEGTPPLESGGGTSPTGHR